MSIKTVLRIFFSYNTILSDHQHYVNLICCFIIKIVKDNKVYCRIPFDSVTITPTGRLHLCCESQHNFSFDTEQLKLNKIESIEKWFNGAYLTKVRQAMIDGKPLKECEFCYKSEKKYGHSSRLGNNQKYFEKHNDIHEASIKKIDMKLGNKCNLKCKMCFPYASSELWKEWKELGWNTDDPNDNTSWKYYDGYFEEDYSWPKDKTNLDKIKDVVVKSKIIHVTGGEPTINPELYQLLKHCIDKGTAKDTVLEITTNATKIHPKFFFYVKQFKQLILTVSIDGTGSTYEYIRYPAKFDTVYNNVLKYREQIDQMPNSKMNITFVLQLWNLHNALDTIQTFGELADWFYIEPLHDPKFMDWHMAPEKTYKDTVYRLYELLQDTNDTNNDLYKRFARIIKTKQPIDKAKWDQLIKFVTAQDGYRGINIQDYIQNLAPNFR